MPDTKTQPEEFLTCCGGIKPIVIPERKEEGEKECTEQF